MDGGIKPKYVKSKPNEVLRLAKLKVKTLLDWRCPVPNFKIDDIFVKKSINGILMQDLQERALKISGDQVITGDLMRCADCVSLLHVLYYSYIMFNI